MPQYRIDETRTNLTPEEIEAGNPAKAKRIYAHEWLGGNREYYSWERIAPLLEGATLKERCGWHIVEKSPIATRKFIKRLDVYTLADGKELHIKY